MIIESEPKACNVPFMVFFIPFPKERIITTSIIPITIPKIVSQLLICLYRTLLNTKAKKFLIMGFVRRR
jgi:hypothetical protein